MANVVPTGPGGVQLPGIKDLTTQSDKLREQSLQALAPVSEQQTQLTQTREQSAKEHADFLNQITTAEQQAAADAGVKRAELLTPVEEATQELAAAQKTPKIFRDLKILFSNITGDDEGTVKGATKRLKSSTQNLNIFEQAELARQKRVKATIEQAEDVEAAEQAVFDAQQKGIDNRLKIASQFSTLARDSLAARTSEIQLSLKLREADRAQRSDVLDALGFDQLATAREQAAGSETGFINLGGVSLGLGDIEQEFAKRQEVQLDIETAQLALVGNRADLADKQFKRALQGLSFNQLEQVHLNNGVMQFETEAGMQESRFPPSLVAEEINTRVKLRQETAGIQGQTDIEAAKATAELDIFARRANETSMRVDSFFGTSSGISSEIGDTLIRASASLSALTGGVTDEGQLSEAIRSGAIPPERAALITKEAARLNQQIEDRVQQIAKDTFPGDKVGQQTLSNFLAGNDSGPQQSLESLIRMSLGGIPRGVVKDSALGRAIDSVREVANGYLQKNLQDAPNLDDLSSENITSLLLDQTTGRIKPEHEGLLGLVADAAYNTWAGATTDSILAASVQDSRSPAFGKIAPSTINAALANAQRIAQAKAPNADQVNDRAALEAAEFMKQLRGIQIDGTNAAELYTQHLQSDAFAGFADNLSQSLRGASYPAYLLDNGAIQGNFLSDLFGIRDLYARQNAELKTVALEKQAQLTEIFSDPGQKQLMAIRLAGYLSAGADPQAVDDFVNAKIQEFGGDPAAIFESIQQNKERLASFEKSRKASIDNLGQAGPILDAILGALASTSGAQQARSVREARQGLGTEEQLRDAFREQEQLNVFPPRGN